MPRVSVIVPNYNYARLLDRRMQTVLEQTFRDTEVLVLDDASSDDSLTVLAQYRDPRIQIQVNKHNSGSVFHQWNLGVSMAKGEFVWLAEADDFSEPTFLERLVGVLEKHPGVGLAYCQSFKYWRSDVAPRRWTDDLPDSEREHWVQDYIRSGHDELARNFVRRCFIPNASSVVFRRSVFDRVGGAPVAMRMSGDYMTWARMMSVADVAYIAEPLNYWSVGNEMSVSRQGMFNGVCLTEALRVVGFIRRATCVPVDILAGRLEEIVREWLVLHRGPSYDIPLSEHVRILGAVLWADPWWGRHIAMAAAERLQGRCGLWA